MSRPGIIKKDQVINYLIIYLISYIIIIKNENYFRIGHDNKGKYK